VANGRSISSDRELVHIPTIPCITTDCSQPISKQQQSLANVNE